MKKAYIVEIDPKVLFWEVEAEDEQGAKEAARGTIDEYFADHYVDAEDVIVREIPPAK